MREGSFPGCAVVLVVVVGVMLLWYGTLSQMCVDKGGHMAPSLLSRSLVACVDDQDREIVVP